MPDQETVEKRAQERAQRREQNAKNRRSYRAKQKEKRAERRKDAPPPPPPAAREHGPGRPKVRQGVVTSAKADKTISVRVDTARRHRMYKKIIRESTTLHAHDERNDANEGDLVRVEESRPMSRTKRWRLTEVLERSR
jgi:small subunit ribosomal protein S17